MSVFPFRASICLCALAVLLSACLKWEYKGIDFLVVETGFAQNLNISTTEVEGSISGLKETVVERHGHCWSAVNELPDLNLDMHNDFGLRGGNGTFTTRIEDLSKNQVYWVRAYAVWQDKIYYGDVITIKTGIGINTDSVQYVGGNTAFGFGSMEISTGSNPIKEQGFVWSAETVKPSINNNKAPAESINEENHFYSRIDQLPIGNSVFLRAYLIEETPDGNNLPLYGKTISIITKEGNIWEKRSAFPGGFGYLSSVSFVIDGKGYVGTGSQGGSYSRKFWRYDPIYNSWESIKDFAGQGRDYAVGMSILGKGYVGTGTSGNTRNLADFWIYDPTNDNWSRMQNFPAGPMQRSVGFSLDGQGFVMARNDNTLYRYDPQSSSWFQQQSLPEFQERNNAAAFVLGNEAYITTGDIGPLNNSTGSRDTWKYNYEFDQWTQAPDFPGPDRIDAISVSDGKKAYVGLGLARFQVLTDFWAYEDQTWSRKADFNGPPLSAITGFLIDERVYVLLEDGSFWVYVPN